MSTLAIGARVRPAPGKGGPPWREGAVEKLVDPPMPSGLSVGVRVTEGALGYLGDLVWCTRDEVEVVG